MIYYHLLQFYFYHCYSYILKYFQLLLLLQIFLIQLVLVLLFFLTFYFQSIRSMLFDLTSIHPLITVYIVAIESLVSSVPKSRSEERRVGKESREQWWVWMYREK